MARALLALVAVLAVAAVASAQVEPAKYDSGSSDSYSSDKYAEGDSYGGKSKPLPFVSPCDGGACSALAALGEVKHCKEDGCADDTCETAVENLCTLVKGAGPGGCDLATRGQVNQQDAILESQINAVVPSFYSTVVRPGTQLLFGLVSVTIDGRYAVEATCNNGEIAVGGSCPGVEFGGGNVGGGFNPVGGVGPVAPTSGGISTPSQASVQSKYQCLYDITVGTTIGTITPYAYVICATPPSTTLTPLPSSSCNSDPFNPFTKN